LGRVEVHATDWTIVLIELVDHCAHSVVAQLQHTAVKTGQHPRSVRVKGNAWQARGGGREGRRRRRCETHDQDGTERTGGGDPATSSYCAKCQRIEYSVGEGGKGRTRGANMAGTEQPGGAIASPFPSPFCVQQIQQEQHPAATVTGEATRIGIFERDGPGAEKRRTLRPCDEQRC
jgi:hypothetical protein